MADNSLSNPIKCTCEKYIIYPYKYIMFPSPSERKQEKIFKNILICKELHPPFIFFFFFIFFKQEYILLIFIQFFALHFFQAGINSLDLRRPFFFLSFFLLFFLHGSILMRRPEWILLTLCPRPSKE